MIRRKPYITIGLVILKKTSNGRSLNKEDKGQAQGQENPSYELIYLKEFQTERQAELEVDLDAGEYVILPRTSGCGLQRPPDASSEKRELLKKNGELSSLAELTIKDICKRLDKIEISNAVEYEEF